MVTDTTHPILPVLDDSVYPLVGHTAEGSYHFASSEQLLFASIRGEPHPSQEQFSLHLQQNATYQQWTHFTVFGRYIQRLFAAFYAQSEDSFNADMLALLRGELQRHCQWLPIGQVLFVGGSLGAQPRQDRLLTTTLNPVAAVYHALNPKHTQQPPPVSQKSQQPEANTVVNLLYSSPNSTGIKAFAVPHNRRISTRVANEVMLLDFSSIRLQKEQELLGKGGCFCLRYYQLNL